MHRVPTRIQELIVCSFLCAACQADAPPPIGQVEQAITATSTGIPTLMWNGVNLFEAVGGYYIIGSCTGADDANNVISTGGDGQTLYSGGNCPGAPYSFAVTGTNPVHIKISVGPLPVDYATLSVPLDPKKTLFSHFSFDGTSYKEGCANTWETVNASSGAFTDISTPCTIPGHGPVGVADVRPPGHWGEITGTQATIRREFVSGDTTSLSFINHPYTNNIEASFAKMPFPTPLSAGSMITFEELLTVYDPQNKPQPNAIFITTSVPSMGAPGSTVGVSIAAKNTGGTGWYAPVRMGALSNNELEWQFGAAGGYSNSLTDQRVFLDQAVLPNASHVFNFSLKLPQQPGTYRFSAQMVHDGVAWFGQKIDTVITVSGDAPTPDAAIRHDLGVSSDQGVPSDSSTAIDSNAPKYDGGVLPLEASAAGDSHVPDQRPVNETSGGCDVSASHPGWPAGLWLLLAFVALCRRRLSSKALPPAEAPAR